MSANFQDIHAPAPLRDKPLWLVWGYESAPGNAKSLKVPYYAAGGRRHGQQGAAADRAKLVTFDVALAATTEHPHTAGVGFALTSDCGVIALDFDNCVTDGVVDRAVSDLVQGTYAEYSPSGNGVRAFFAGAADLLGNRKSPTTPTQFGAEVFSSTGFVTVTGQMLDHVDLLGWENTVAPLPQSVIDFCQQRFVSSAPAVDPDDFMVGFEPKLGLTPEQMETLVNALDPDMGREDWIRVGMALHHECEGDDTGFCIWDEWSSGGATYPSEEGLRQQWASFDRRTGTGRKQTTMASVIYLAKKEGLQWPPVATTAQAVERALVAPDTGRYALRRPSELANAKPAGWLIKGVLPAADLVVLYGASGAGKSFVALDMAAAIARGVPWRGKRTTKGVVVYIAAEGGGGMGNRFKAYAAHHNINLNELDVVTITAAPNFLDLDDVTEVIAKINTLPAVTTIVVDTLAQVTPGANENGAEDMGRALANARTLREATGATVVIIHHAGKDLSRGSRGWSGIKAAADAEIEVRRHEDGGREIAVSKIREGDDSARWGFRLDTVVLGVDEDGDAITSCVAVEVEPLTRSADGPGPKSLSLYEGHVLEVIATLGAQDKIPFSRLVDVATDALPTGGPHSRDVRRNNVVRAIQTLSRQKDGAIRLVGQTVIFYK